MSTSTTSHQQKADRWLQENREAVESPSLGCTQQALLVQQAKQAVLLDEIRALEGTLDDSNKSASACLAKLKALESQIGVNQEALTYLEQVTSLETVFISAGQQVMEKALQMSTVTDGVVLEAKKELSAEVGGAWSWVSQLADLNRLHTRNAADYQAFHHSAYELNALLNSRASSSSAAIAAIPANGMLGSIKRMNTVLTDNFAQFNRLWQLAGDLTQRSRAVVPLQQRFNADATPFAGKNVFKFDDGETVLEAGEEVTVIDNSQSYTWKVRRSDGSEVEVPSTCIWLAPADPQAVQLAIGLKKKLLNTWSQVLSNLRQWSAEFFDCYLNHMLKNPVTVSRKIKDRVTDFLKSLQQFSGTFLNVDEQLADSLRKSVDKVLEKFTVIEGPMGSLVESELVILQNCLTRIQEHLNEWRLCSSEALEMENEVQSRTNLSKETSEVQSRIELLTRLQEESQSKLQELQNLINKWKLHEMDSKFKLEQRKNQLLFFDRSSLSTMDDVTGVPKAPMVQMTAQYNQGTNEQFETQARKYVQKNPGKFADILPVKTKEIDTSSSEFRSMVLKYVEERKPEFLNIIVSWSGFRDKVRNYVEENTSEFAETFASWTGFETEARKYVEKNPGKFAEILPVQTKETDTSSSEFRSMVLNYVEEHKSEFIAIVSKWNEFSDHVRRYVAENVSDFSDILLSWTGFESEARKCVQKNPEDFADILPVKTKEIDTSSSEFRSMVLKYVEERKPEFLNIIGSWNGFRDKVRNYVEENTSEFAETFASWTGFETEARKYVEKNPDKFADLLTVQTKETDTSSSEFHSMVLKHVAEHKSEFISLLRTWREFDDEVSRYLEEQAAKFVDIFSSWSGFEAYVRQYVLRHEHKFSDLYPNKARDPDPSSSEFRAQVLEYVKEHVFDLFSVFTSWTAFCAQIRHYVLDHEKEFSALLGIRVEGDPQISQSGRKIESAVDKGAVEPSLTTLSKPSDELVAETAEVIQEIDTEDGIIRQEKSSGLESSDSVTKIASFKEEPTVFTTRSTAEPLNIEKSASSVPSAHATEAVNIDGSNSEILDLFESITKKKPVEKLDHRIIGSSDVAADKSTEKSAVESFETRKEPVSLNFVASRVNGSEVFNIGGSDGEMLNFSDSTSKVASVERHAARLAGPESKTESSEFTSFGSRYESVHGTNAFVASSNATESEADNVSESKSELFDLLESMTKNKSVDRVETGPVRKTGGTEFTSFGPRTEPASIDFSVQGVGSSFATEYGVAKSEGETLDLSDRTSVLKTASREYTPFSSRKESAPIDIQGVASSHAPQTEVGGSESEILDLFESMTKKTPVKKDPAAGTFDAEWKTGRSEFASLGSRTEPVSTDSGAEVSRSPRVTDFRHENLDTSDSIFNPKFAEKYTANSSGAESTSARISESKPVGFGTEPVSLGIHGTSSGRAASLATESAAANAGDSDLHDLLESMKKQTPVERAAVRSFDTDWKTGRSQAAEPASVNFAVQSETSSPRKESELINIGGSEGKILDLSDLTFKAKSAGKSPARPSGTDFETGGIADFKTFSTRTEPAPVSAPAASARIAVARATEPAAENIGNSDLRDLLESMNKKTPSKGREAASLETEWKAETGGRVSSAHRSVYGVGGAADSSQLDASVGRSGGGGWNRHFDY